MFFAEASAAALCSSAQAPEPISAGGGVAGGPCSPNGFARRSPYGYVRATWTATLEIVLRILLESLMNSFGTSRTIPSVVGFGTSAKN
eukprot:12592515-Alexandrium_andersonii.AAC.1